MSWNSFHPETPAPAFSGAEKSRRESHWDTEQFLLSIHMDKDPSLLSIVGAEAFKTPPKQTQLSETPPVRVPFVSPTKVVAVEKPAGFEKLSELGSHLRSSLRSRLSSYNAEPREPQEF